MRIGEFAQKHNITQDTIRHYLDMGLLVAEKTGGQYKFSEADSKDIDKIIELKQLDFSLAEIQRILTFQRLSGTNTDAFRNLLLTFLEGKKREITKGLIKYNKMNAYLTDKIHEIKAEELKVHQRLGLPMTSLGVLACPLCQHSLHVSDGTIESNAIIDANIQCQCGFKAVIRNGIYIDEQAVRTKMVNGKKMPGKEEYLANSSHTYINFLYRGMASLIEHINKYGKEAKCIMELNNCVGFFLLQYIKYLPADSTYILIDYDIDRIIQLKTNLEMYYEHKNFMFLCCDFHRLPIINSTIDIMVDFWMTRTYAQATGEFLLDKVLPLLKQDGLFAASYPYIGPSPKDSLKLAPEIKDYLNKDKMLEKLSNSHLAALEVIDIAPVCENNQYDIDTSGAELSQAVFIGKKRTINYIKPKVNNIRPVKNKRTSG